MGARQTGRAPYKGIAIPADRITLDRLTPQGAGLTDSSFSQAGPRPGSATSADPRAKLDPEVSGAQKVAIEVQVRNAGLPGRAGVGLVWKRTDEADNFAWRDRAVPNFANHWIGAEYSTVNAYDRFDLISSPGTGALVLVYARSAASGVVNARRFEFPVVDETANPQAAPTQTGQWSSAVVASANPRVAGGLNDQAQWIWVTGVALPGGRMLCIANAAFQKLHVWSSDDGGATWAPYARPVQLPLFNADRGRAAYYRGDILLLVNDEGGDTYEQLASNSLGTEFVSVELQFGAFSNVSKSICVAAIPGDGGIAVGYLREGDSRPVVRVLSSAFQPLSTAAEVVVTANALDELELLADEAGRLWAIGRRATLDGVLVWSSVDGGASWASITDGGSGQAALFLAHLSTVRLTNFAAAFVRGWCVLAHNKSVPTSSSSNGSIGTLWSAGWGSVGHNSGNTSLGGGHSPILSRISWGQTASGVSPTQSAVGIPIELPASGGSGWTNILTVAPTLVSPGELQWVLAAQTGAIELASAGTAGGEHSVMVEMWVAAGTTGVASLQAGFELRIANGVTSRRIEVRLGTSVGGWRVVDAVSGATLADVVWDVTKPTQWVAGINASGNLMIGYRRPWHSRWFKGPSLEGVSVLTDGGGVPTTNRIRIGATAAATATIRVRQWHHAQTYFGAEKLSFGVRSSNDASDMYHRIGALISTAPEALPEVGDQGVSEAHLAATRGPGVSGETYTIEPVYDHGVDRLFPTISPSPSETWRSADLSAQSFVFDLGIDSRIGPIWHLLFGAFNTNVKVINVRAKTAAAGAFSLIGTYDAGAGFGSLSFARNGDWIRPASGTAAGARFIERNSLAGGFAILDLAGSPVALEIDANGPGFWTNPATSNTLLPEIRLRGVTGATPSSGLCDLVFPSGVRPIRFQATNPPTEFWRYIQIEIPSQPCPHSYYEVGALFLGTSLVFGKRWSRGWSRSMLPNTARRVSRFGTIRKRRDGPPAMRWSMGWTDGVSRRGLIASTSPDFLSVSPGGSPEVPIATVGDVLGSLFALLEETDGTARPVVALDSIPDGTTPTTITDRLRFMLGTVDANAQHNNVTGEESEGDFGRIDPISISELV